jgi:hypothetical protein
MRNAFVPGRRQLALGALAAGLLPATARAAWHQAFPVVSASRS